MNLQKLKKNALTPYFPSILLRNRTAVLFFVSLLVWVGLIGSGCQPAKQLPGPVRPDQNIHKTVLRFSTWGSAEEMKVVKGLVQEFERTHPHIDVDVLHVPDQYFQKLHILIAADMAPDVMFTNSLYVPVYSAYGIFADLTPYLNASSSDKGRAIQTGLQADVQADDFYPQALTACTGKVKATSKNILAAIPRDISNLVVFYNRNLFDQAHEPYPQPNWTWAQFLKTAQALTVDQEKDGHPEQFAIGFNRTPPLFWLPYVWSAGGDLFNADLTRPRFEESAVLKGLQFYADWRNRYHIAPTQKEAGQATMSQLFLQQKTAMMVSGRWSVPIFRNQAAFEWDVVPLPQGPAGSKTGIDASGFAMSAKTANPKAAWELIAFLSSQTASKAYAESGLIVPARLDVALSETFLNPSEKPAHSRVFLDVIASGVPTRTPPRWNEISEMLGVALDPVWDGLKSPEEALRPLLNQIQPLLNDERPSSKEKTPQEQAH
jgi:multiple sugar transport system substrate-binding protein